ncbi:sensor histidine kinase [Planococcus alpniumensis]|uniref:sensor histidine kinase n=1 Tax=Planococcus alpniumensis TaxID=2708345 RepID=UPI001B8C14BC|nr:HAMP domain-containing sensor histidine kinase [Planococcus sp. MSAK28401]
MKKWMWLAGLSLLLLCVWTVMEKGSGYFGKAYTDTEDFRYDFARFTDGLLLFELAPPTSTVDQSVASWELDQYRMDHISLTDQIQMVRDQYADAISAAEEEGDSSLVEELEEQRGEEISAVRENFSDDEAAKKAIIEQREADYEESLRQLAEQQGQFEAQASGYAYQLKDLDSGEVFTKGTITDEPFFEQLYSAQEPLYFSNGYWSFDFPYDDANSTLADNRFSGVIQIPEKGLAGAAVQSGMNQFQLLKFFLYFVMAAVAASAWWLVKKRPVRTAWYTGLTSYHKWQKLAIEWKLSGFIVSAMLALAAANHFAAVLTRPWQGGGSSFLEVFIALALAVLFWSLTILQAIWLRQHFGKWSFFKEEIQQSFTASQVYSAKDAFLNRTIGFQMAWVLAIVFLWGAGTAFMILQPVVVIVWLPATLLIGLPLLLFLMTRFGYLNRLLKGTEQLAAGSLGAELKVKGKSPLSRHAQHLNVLREGYRASVSERAKSERLKTELITNVSHDLRTPLTSIITYTDLLKNEDLGNEERRKYVDILDRKSERLKVLIEDLFEVSKMASGNAELSKQRLDMKQLVTQALAEHEEAVQEAELDVRIAAPGHPVYASVDGQKWWRLLDNLILNATKYSLPGSRVYITLTEQASELAMTMKNVTRYELGDNTEELLERFK